MKQLILNADDFGMTQGVNKGIIRAHRDGILTSTTLMANGPEFADAVALAKLNPELGVGCHLVLVGGPAVAPKEKISSLVDENGNLPDSLGGFVARLSAGLIRTKAIDREMRAQIAKIRAATLAHHSFRHHERQRLFAYAVGPGEEQRSRNAIGGEHFANGSDGVRIANERVESHTFETTL